MKRIFDNAMTAHVWAQRSQSEGRSSNGNFSFCGDTLYSYSTPIGRFIDVPRKGTAILVTSRRYSVTTSGKHMPALWRAIGYGAENVFRVPNVCPVGRDTEHARNLEHLASEYDTTTTATIRRARDIYLDAAQLAAKLAGIAATAASYARFFGLKAPKRDPEADAARIMAARAEREAKRNTPAAIAKREAARAARERKAEREAELQRAESTERVAAWRAGELSQLRYGEQSSESGGAMLRVRGAKLETSQGASVPLAEAIRVFQFAKLCRARGEGWQRNGARCPVGHFNVDSIEPDGSFRAGCHRIHWPEIEAAALQAGVLSAEPSDAAIIQS